MKIAILDYDVGNLRSVSKALEYVGARTVITKNPDEASAADALILPGVGAFRDACESFRQSGLEPALRCAVGAGKPVLGICLGMQLLMKDSTEHGLHEGLCLFPASITRFTENSAVDWSALKIPHMGWNSIKLNPKCPLFNGLPDVPFVYFVHSFCVKGAHEWSAATCEYGEEFTAAVWRGNLFGTQFHPEKSGEVGLQILRNFIAISEGRLC
ncbi:MAG: imidazole glycerol phosphate synthase subunit HisH [Oscillospiraceae bacterium]|jgi:glutamine amidotransferase|nr:imidazole glycerol phosphate synthase subunit HisH [Oscillospiraceae bacterium]